MIVEMKMKMNVRMCEGRQADRKVVASGSDKGSGSALIEETLAAG
jgi:hypothetical protein